MLKQVTFALLATLGLASGAFAQDVQMYSTPDSATLKAYHDGDVDTTTCSSSIGGVYCNSYTTTVEASLIGHALEEMLPADTYDAGRDSISALKVLPDALQDAMRESCASKGFWKQRRDPDCNPMAQIDAMFQMTSCLGSKSVRVPHPGLTEYTCSLMYERAYQQYLTNLKRGVNSRGYPVIYRLKTRDEVLWEYASTFLPISILSDTSKQFPDGNSELKQCLARFRSVDEMKVDVHCVALYNRAADLYNASHKGGSLVYTKVAAD